MIVIYNGPDLDYKGKEIYFGSNVDEVVIVDVDLINQTPPLFQAFDTAQRSIPIRDGSRKTIDTSLLGMSWMRYEMASMQERLFWIFQI
ncbi:MAG: hypothetical protein CM15mP58_22760 [Burkholderiaceae bacterium]|nr:MAG: hypothetical protein CM15mP58_22760 [Burkholderiaceae bacterium]